MKAVTPKTGTNTDHLDAFDRDIAKTRTKRRPQGATSGGALAGDSLSRSGSVTPKQGKHSAVGAPGDAIMGGKAAQLPSGVTQGVGAAIRTAPELGARGMPPNPRPISTGSSTPAQTAKNAGRPPSPEVMGGRFRRVRG